MKKIDTRFGTLILGFLMSNLIGCASIVDGTKQKIIVETPPTTDAICLLSNDKGRWHVKTPGSVIVHKSSDNLAVACQKKGYSTKEVDVASKTEAMTYGNILLGGIVGIGIDDSDGAAYRYPDTVRIPMNPVQN